MLQIHDTKDNGKKKCTFLTDKSQALTLKGSTSALLNCPLSIVAFTAHLSGSDAAGE